MTLLLPGINQALPRHLTQRRYYYDMVKHYGDWTNPVEHSHLYRWGADMTKALKRIIPKTSKQRKRKIVYTEFSDEIRVQDHRGVWFPIEKYQSSNDKAPVEASISTL